jgi:hypothetical protein
MNPCLAAAWTAAMTTFVFAVRRWRRDIQAMSPWESARSSSSAMGCVPEFPGTLRIGHVTA